MLADVLLLQTTDDVRFKDVSVTLTRLPLGSCLSGDKELKTSTVCLYSRELTTFFEPFFSNGASLELVVKFVSRILFFVYIVELGSMICSLRVKLDYVLFKQFATFLNLLLGLLNKKLSLLFPYN